MFILCYGFVYLFILVTYCIAIFFGSYICYLHFLVLLLFWYLLLHCLELYNFIVEKESLPTGSPEGDLFL